MEVLIIGGTRFVGHHLAIALLERGDRVTTFNRGLSPDDLPPEVERLRGDRTVPGALAKGVGGRAFDAAVDMIAMRGEETQDAIAALEGSVGRFVHVSTGQVYLVRTDCPTPAREEDYAGPLCPPPPPESWEAREWRYGVSKRECEDALEAAWSAGGFPAVRLRMPIIHGPRDPSGRLRRYVERVARGEPLYVPREPTPPLRHVWAGDVVHAITRAMAAQGVQGRAFNVASDDLWSHDRFVARIGEILGVEPRVVRRPRGELEADGLFPGSTPFASPWMSILDNAGARAELDLQPRGFDDFLPDLIRCSWRPTA